MATVGILGLGLMGSSLALALKKADPATELIGVDRDDRAARNALETGIVNTASTNAVILDQCEVVFLAVPVLAMRDALRIAARHCRGAVVTDLCSTKVQVLEWAKEAGVDLVGGHPMAGREKSGQEAADADLYRNAIWVMARPDETIDTLVRSIGAKPLVMDPARHDELVAGVSHAAFMVSVAYVLSLTRQADWHQMAELASSGFADMSRLAAGDTEMYAGIVATNRQNIATQIDEMLVMLAAMRRALDGDDQRLRELFEEAKVARDRWRELHAGPR